MDGREERCRRADAAGDREEIQPLIGEDAAEGAREGLDETHVLTPDSAGVATRGCHLFMVPDHGVQWDTGWVVKTAVMRPSG